MQKEYESAYAFFKQALDIDIQLLHSSHPSLGLDFEGHSFEDHHAFTAQDLENIDIVFSDFIDKRIELRAKDGDDSIFEEALKATNKCGREWRAKAYGYMWRMALKTWEDGDYFDDGSHKKTSKNEDSVLKFGSFLS